MTRTLGIVGLTLGATLTAGCSDKTPAHSTAWYFDHPQAAKERVAECDALALKDRNTDCLNANNAAVELSLHGQGAIGNPYGK